MSSGLTESRESSVRLEVLGSRWVPAGALALAIALWILSLPRIDIDAMTDTGLVSVLPVTAFLSLVVLTVGFVATSLRPGRLIPIWSAYVATFIVFIHGTPALLYGTLRYPWGWKHVGVVDYIQRHGAVDPNVANLDIYHGWPGFFGLNALLTEAAGLESSLSYASWAPMFFNLAILLTLVFLFRPLTGDARVVAFASWFYFLASWVGQDYFAPQALTFLLYLVILGIVLRWFRSAPLTVPVNRSGGSVLLRFRSTMARWVASLRRGPVWRISPPQDPELIDERSGRLSVGQQGGLLVFLLFTMFVIASSHQLTPVMTIVTLTGLVVVGLIRPWSLPISMAVITLLWVVTGASTYVWVNIGELGETGRVLSNVQGTFVDLGQLSSGQVLVSWISRSLTALVLLLAVMGGVRSYLKGTWQTAAIVLAIAPVSLAVLSTYGTEILFRVYLFALPFAAFLVAVLLLPDEETVSGTRTRVAALGMSLVFLVGFLFAYYGNEQFNYFTHAEVQAADYLYSTAPEGSLIVEGSRSYPGLARNHEYFVYVPITREPWDTRSDLVEDAVPRLSRWLTDDRYPASFLIITRSQKLHAVAQGQMPPGGLETIESALLESPDFVVWYSNDDVTIFVSSEQGSGT